MLIDTGKVFHGKVEFGREFSCNCGNGIVDHDIRYSTLCIGYAFSCLSCNDKYFVAMASLKIYQRNEVKSAA